MATEVLQLGIDSTGAAQGARQFERATSSVQQSATKADAATSRMEGSFNKLRATALTLTRALGALGVTIGAGALVRSVARATADMDTLRRSLDAVTGSSTETARQLKELREVAKLPGLGFREAVQGAVNLEVVGFSAKETTRILKDFGNAVALTGGGKNELDRVIFQFTQMSTLGKVTSQDLKPILQTAPAVAKAMLAAFGTISPEKIAAMGLTFDQFTAKLLGAMEKLPQATGGVKNSFENLSDATFQASAAFGTNFAGAVSSILDPLSKSLLALADNGRAMREVADGVAALAKALLVGGAIAGVLKLAKALREVELATVALQALKGPQGWLVIGVAALATYLYKQGSAARNAADAVDRYAASLSNLSRQGLLNQQAGLNLSASYLQSQLANTPATVQKGLSMGTGGGGRLITVPNPEFERLQGQLDSVIRQSVAVAAALAATTSAKGGGGPTPPDEDTITKAMDAAFGRFAVQYGFLMPRLANDDDIIAARGGLGRAGLLGVSSGAVAVPTVPAGPTPTRFDSLRASAAKFGGGINDQIAGLAAQFGPLAIAAAALKPVFDGLRAVLEPVLSKLARPLEVMGRILGDVVAPVLELLQDPLEAVATLFSVLAQPLKLMVDLFKAYVTPGLKILGGTLKIITSGLSYIVEGIGYVIKGVGQVVDKLVPDFISHAGKGLAKTGQDIIDGAERARHGFDAVATASDKLAASLSTDLPKAINLALYRARIGAPGGGTVGGGPIAGGGGGIGSGYHPPAYTPGNHPRPAPEGAVVMNFAPGSVVNAAGDDHVTIARKFAKGAQVLHSQGEKLYAPGLVTAA